jgi:hypothetical protein
MMTPFDMVGNVPPLRGPNGLSGVHNRTDVYIAPAAAAQGHPGRDRAQPLLPTGESSHVCVSRTSAHVTLRGTQLRAPALSGRLETEPHSLPSPRRGPIRPGDSQSSRIMKINYSSMAHRNCGLALGLSGSGGARHHCGAGRKSIRQAPSVAMRAESRSSGCICAAQGRCGGVSVKPSA